MEIAASTGIVPEDCSLETPESWVPGRLPLRYVVGGVCVFAKKFPSLVLDKHHTELLASSAGLSLPVGWFSSGVQVLVVQSHPVQPGMPRLRRLEDRLTYIPESFVHHVTELEPSFPAYLAKLSAKARHEMLRKVRKFSSANEGAIQCREFRLGSEMAEFQQLALEVSKKTYQEQLLDAGLPDTLEHQQEIERLAEEDMVRGYVLFFGEQPIAYGYCSAQRNVLLYHHTGYDPAYREWSPGIVLLHEMFARLHAEGRFKMLDFGSGNAQWKEWYGTRHTHCAAIYTFRPTWRNQVFVVLHLGLNSWSERAGKWFEKLGIKQRIKRFLRASIRKDA